MTKNVIVLDTFGNEVGRTYDKRARGLVKSGRATEVEPGTIRLVQAPNSDVGTDMKGTFYMNTILFNARDFKCADYADRTFITDADGAMTEVITLGDWDKGHRGVIQTKPIRVEDSEQRFVFWLNGGENEAKDEICQLQIIPTDYEDDAVSADEEELKLTYKLNRSFVKPLKKYKGWNLYSIPFSTGDKAFAVIRFVSQGAYTTVKAAKAPEEYADLKNVTDRYEQYRPLRHNIVFEDGWDNEEEYATRYLKDIWGDGKDDVWTEGHAIDQDTLDAWAKSLGEFARKVSDQAQEIGTKAVEKGREAGEKYGPKAAEAGKKYGAKAVEIGKEGVDFAKKGMDKILASDAVKKFSDKLTEMFKSAPAADAEYKPAEETEAGDNAEPLVTEEPETVTDTAETTETPDTAETSDTSDTTDI